MLVYAYKVVVSVTITVMLTRAENSSVIGDECPFDDGDRDHNKSLALNVETFEANSPYVFNWTDSERGLALGAYFYGYVLTQVSLIHTI